MIDFSDVIEEIKRDEGFRGMPYRDSRGYPTIGYGTLLPIDEVEAELLLEKRLSETVAELRAQWPHFDDLPKEARSILTNMSYNLGVPRLMEFKKMLAALEDGDYEKAAFEMKDSLWYKQVGKRAERLVEKMTAIA